MANAHKITTSFTLSDPTVFVTGVNLLTLTRSDTGLTPAGNSSFQFTLGSDGKWTCPFTDPAAPPPLYNYTFTFTLSNGQTSQVLTGELNPFAATGETF